jgi:tRNA(Ile)-lysidine synthase
MGVVVHVREAVAASAALDPGRRVLVLLSGGRDSTCLLDVVVASVGADAVSALHVDHGLREGSAAGAEHCRALCRKLGVDLEVEHAGPAPSSGNIHQWARDARYGLAAQRVLTDGAVVATGHTASDQAETVLYRLATSPGRRALLGMPVRDGRLVRPLLAVTREQTADYCVARGLEWLEDPANDDPAYARTRVRHDLLAALRTLHPAAEQNVVDTAARLRDEAAVLDGLVDAELEGRDSISLARLSELAPALAKLVVRALAERALGGAPASAAARRFDEVLALRDGGALDLGGGLRALVDAGHVRFVVLDPPPGTMTPGPPEAAGEPGGRAALAGDP